MTFATICRRALDVMVDREIIGQPECPLMIRWTLFDRWGVKVLIHRFPANVTDTDPHDHPRPFATLVLKGEYKDTETDGDVKLLEWVRQGAFRYRPAKYLHIVETGKKGAWTLVVMGPLSRPWGFVRDGKWWPWERYVSKFGGTIRCEEGTHVEVADQTTRAPSWRPTDFPD